MPRTVKNMSRPPFVVDVEGLDRTSGRQIDWSRVADSRKTARGAKVIPPGTVLAVTAAGKAFPRADRGAGAETAVEILLTEAIEDSQVASRSGYGTIYGGRLYADALPDATGNPKALPAAYLTELDAARTNFSFEPYVDQR